MRIPLFVGLRLIVRDILAAEHDRRAAVVEGTDLFKLRGFVVIILIPFTDEVIALARIVGADEEALYRNVDAAEPRRIGDITGERRERFAEIIVIGSVCPAAEGVEMLIVIFFGGRGRAAVFGMSADAVGFDVEFIAIPVVPCDGAALSGGMRCPM